jgi:hypothetical protein
VRDFLTVKLKSFTVGKSSNRIHCKLHIISQLPHGEIGEISKCKGQKGVANLGDFLPGVYIFDFTPPRGGGEYDQKGMWGKILKK